MLVITIYLIFSMLVICWFDITKYIIPNWLVGSLLLVYPLAVWLSPHPVEWKLALIGMLAVFAVGYVIFALKWMGGGDIKLLMACALWVGLKGLPDFLFMVAMIGAVFTLALIVIRKLEPRLPRKENASPLPRILRGGEPVPYGVAITLGFLLMLWLGRIPAIVFG